MATAKISRSHTLIFVLSTIVLFACSPTPTPPNPESASGVYIQAGYEFIHWEEGLTLMIWHDGIKSSQCDTSTSDQKFALRCHAASKNDVRFDWQLETSDGKTAGFSIDQTSYDLADGNLFIILTTSEATQVRQLQRDLSGVAPDASSVIEYGQADPLIQVLIQGMSTFNGCVPSSRPSATNVDFADIQLIR